MFKKWTEGWKCVKSFHVKITWMGEMRIRLNTWGMFTFGAVYICTARRLGCHPMPSVSVKGRHFSGAWRQIFLSIIHHWGYRILDNKNNSRLFSYCHKIDYETLELFTALKIITSVSPVFIITSIVLLISGRSNSIYVPWIQTLKKKIVILLMNLSITLAKLCRIQKY